MAAGFSSSGRAASPYSLQYSLMAACVVILTVHHLWRTAASDERQRQREQLQQLTGAMNNGGCPACPQQPVDLRRSQATPAVEHARPAMAALPPRALVGLRPAGDAGRFPQCPASAGFLTAHENDAKSQHRQDQVAFLNFFQGVCGRTYVEIGAFDGVINSNTFFFNKHMNWTGILVEANPTSFAKAKANRPSDRVYHAAITNDNAETVTFLFNDQRPQLNGIANVADAGRMRSFQEVQVPVNTFRKIFAETGVTRVDFFSLDVEGAEYIVLQTIDFDAVTICIMVTENNPRAFDREKNAQVGAFLRSKGFVGYSYRIDTFWVNPKCPEYVAPAELLH